MRMTQELPRLLRRDSDLCSRRYPFKSPSIALRLSGGTHQMGLCRGVARRCVHDRLVECIAVVRCGNGVVKPRFVAFGGLGKADLFCLLEHGSNSPEILICGFLFFWLAQATGWCTTGTAQTKTPRARHRSCRFFSTAGFVGLVHRRVQPGDAFVGDAKNFKKSIQNGLASLFSLQLNGTWWRFPE